MYEPVIYPVCWGWAPALLLLCCWCMLGVVMASALFVSSMHTAKCILCCCVCHYEIVGTSENGC